MSSQQPLPSLKTTTINLKTYLGAKDLYDYFYQMSQRHGDFVLVKGLVDMYIVNHPELVKQVLKESNLNFDKRSPFYIRFRRMFGLGIVTSEDEDWKTQRAIMQPLFTTKASRLFYDSMLKGIQETDKRWAGLIGQDVDLLREMNDTALDIVSQAFLSQALGEKKHDIEAWVSDINRYIGGLPIPIISEPWFPRPSSWRGWLAKRKFRRYIHDIIQQRRKEDVVKEDLLGVLLSAGEKLSEESLVDQLMTLIFGGHETSATAMVWTWYLLALNPEADKKMQAELEQVLGDRTPKVEDLTKLEYTKAVIEESMRLYPPFWFENRNTKHTIKLGDTEIPKGKMIVFSRYSLQRSPKLWEDPEVFRPERFLVDPANPSTRHRFASVPFGGGPRICVGINFARMEILMVFAVLARKYRLVINKNHRHELSSDLTLSPKYGMTMKIERR